MKKKALLAACAMLVILICSGSTIAFFNAKDKADNVFTVGRVSITLTEPSWEESGDHTILADASYPKDPTVTNTGNTDAYVRIHVVITDLAAFGEAQPGYEPSNMLNVSSDWILTDTVIDTNEDTVSYVYTYKGILPAKTEAPPLFTEVVIPSFADADMIEAMDGSFDIEVYADAIQAESFADAKEAFAAFDS